MTKKKTTTINSATDQSQQNVDWISKETKNKKEKINETLNSTNIVDTMEFYLPNKWFTEVIKKELEKEDCENLKDAKIICFELIMSTWDKLTDFKWIDLAMEEIIKNPNVKIILTSFMDPNSEDLESKKDKIDFLLSKPNVKFIRFPFMPKDLISLFDKPKENKEEAETAFQKIIEQEIIHFLHSFRYKFNAAKNLSYTDEDILEYYLNQLEDEKLELKDRMPFENRLINLLQIEHPSFKLLPRKNNFQWIVDIYKYMSTKTLPEWTKFEGVFVDRDWTLYDNKNLKFNQNIIDMIKKYEKEWKEIIIRTQWNLEMKQKLLDEAKLPYVIKSKTDYKWATVEIAIDNDDPELLLANAKIKAEKYIKV